MTAITYISIISVRCYSNLSIDTLNPHSKPLKQIILIIIPVLEMRKLTKELAWSYTVSTGARI